MAVPPGDRSLTKNSTILILAGDTDGNLGDLAIVTATCECIRRLDPSIRISLVTSRPERDSQRLGISPIPRGLRGLPTLIRAARRADLVICGGGGLFQDDNSLIKMPYWALRLTLLRLVAPRIAGFSIGAGPLNHGVSRLFARLALKMLQPVSVRDSSAKAWLQPLTRKDIEIVPDPAFMLQGKGSEDALRNLADGGVPLDGTPLIGVAVRRWFHTDSDLIPHMYAYKLGLRRRRGQAEMDEFTTRCANDLDQVVRATKAHVVFLPTYNVGHEDDAAVCGAIARKMSSEGRSTILLDDPKTLKEITARLSVILCGRLHPAILAAGHGIPIVGLSYNSKFTGTFDQLPVKVPWMSISDYVRNGANSWLAGRLLLAIECPVSQRARTGDLENRTRRYIERLVSGLVTDELDATVSENAGR